MHLPVTREPRANDAFNGGKNGENLMQPKCSMLGWLLWHLRIWHYRERSGNIVFRLENLN